jgi:hypothetical protein
MATTSLLLRFIYADKRLASQMQDAFNKEEPYGCYRN